MPAGRVGVNYMLNKIFGEVEDYSLVEKALTHPSYTKELNLDSLTSYERLEFFGDSVLKLFTSKLLYENYLLEHLLAWQPISLAYAIQHTFF